MKNIVNNYSSIEQLTNQYLNKQKSMMMYLLQHLFRPLYLVSLEQPLY